MDYVPNASGYNGVDTASMQMLEIGGDVDWTYSLSLTYEAVSLFGEEILRVGFVLILEGDVVFYTSYSL